MKKVTEEGSKVLSGFEEEKNENSASKGTRSGVK